MTERNRRSVQADIWVTTNDVTRHASLPEGETSVGSAPSNDLVIAGILPEHLVFRREGARVWATSVGSALSTQFAGRPMATGIEIAISPGDAITADGADGMEPRGHGVSFRFGTSAVCGVRLRVEMDGGSAWERVVDQVDFTIGRANDSEVVLPRARVSRQHARVVFREGRLVLSDLRSTTGTSVNRERIHSPTTLRPDDVVGIDGLRIEMSVATDHSANPFEDHDPPAWIFEGDSSDRAATVADGLPINDDNDVEGSAFSLELRFAGQHLGIYEVVDEVVVGREETCSLSIDTPALGPRHARFAIDGGALFVHDLGTTRGTFVNGRRVESIALLEGDRVELGPVTFVIGHHAAPSQRTSTSEQSTRAATTQETRETVDSGDETSTLDVESTAEGPPVHFGDATRTSKGPAFEPPTPKTVEEP